MCNGKKIVSQTYRKITELKTIILDDKLRCKTVCYKLKVDFKVYRAVKTYSKTMVSEFFSSDVFFALFFLISCYA